MKPAFEPIVLARKPLEGTVAENVRTHGTGASKIDGCRIATGERWEGGDEPVPRTGGIGFRSASSSPSHRLGRRPANVALDEEAAAQLDAQSGRLRSGRLLSHHRRSGGSRIGTFQIRKRTGEPCSFGGDAGGASRFFYCAKASRPEREAGLEPLPLRRFAQSGGGQTDAAGGRERYRDSLGLNRVKTVRNTHPTVKPVALMRWLVRLVTPPGGLVLDPFAGAGTTGIACLLERVGFCGIEQEPGYVEIARARIAHWANAADPPAEVKAA